MKQNPTLSSLLLSLMLFSVSDVNAQLTAVITDSTANCSSSGPADELVGSATGGTSPYSYEWFDNSWSSLGSGYEFFIWGNSYGTYHLIVTDDNSDVDTASITLSYQAFDIDIEPVEKSNGSNATCNGQDGQIDVDITGGTPPYQVTVYNWPKDLNNFSVSGNLGGTGASFSPQRVKSYSVSSTDFTIDSLPPGLCEVVISSNSGSCYISRTTYLEPYRPEVNLTGVLYPNGYYTSCPACSDGEFTIHVPEGSQTLMWFDIDSIFTPDIFVSGSTFSIPWDYVEGHGPGEADLAGLVIGTDSVISGLEADKWYAALAITAEGCYAIKPLKIERPYVPRGIWSGGTGAVDSSWVFGTSNNESLMVMTNDTIRMTIESNGQVAIGVDQAPSDYLLAVGGKVIAEEVELQLQGDWPDYVFEEGYDLMSLELLEAYIEKHGHLPGFPSAEDLENGGTIASGAMVKTLVEKVEELSLHVIQLQKEVNALKRQNTDISKKVLRIHKDVKSRGGNGYGHGDD